MSELANDELLRIQVISDLIKTADQRHEKPKEFELVKKALHIVLNRKKDPEMYNRFKCVVTHGFDPKKN